MIGREYQAVSIIISKSFVDILVLSLFVFYHFNYTNIFYYHAKAVLLDNLHNLFRYLDL